MAKIVLLVDDEEAVRVMLGKLIERQGHTVFRAATGMEGIQLYKEHSPNCVLLDVKLPDMEGTEVLGKILEINPQAKIYLVTGVSDDDRKIEVKAEELGAKGYISKPVDVYRILDIVENC
ncbi:MAG: response regulator [Candidatus Omnitrophica bacterium]|nr:response regulator [Candidatus Omnitrophota bacterium]